MGVNLKLCIDKQSCKVLYAEAGKGFIDFLFHLMVLPAGVVIGLAKDGSSPGSLGSLHNSINRLVNPYIEPSPSLHSIEDAPSVGSISPLFGESVSSAIKHFYVCSRERYLSCRDYVTPLLSNHQRCPSCGEFSLNRAVSSAEPQFWWEGGYVDDAVSYLVRDDLAVMPLSTDACIELLSSLNLKDPRDIERKETDFGLDQVVEFVRASLLSKTVLTDVFLGV